MRRWLPLVSLVCVLALPGTPEAAPPTLRWDAFGSVGGRAKAGAIGVGMTLGEAVIGTAAAGSLNENVGFWHLYIGSVTSVEPAAGGAMPRLGLGAIVPNPSRGVAAIHFAAPAASVPIELEILDLSGRVVRVLASGSREPGAHQATWDGRAGDGSVLPSGVYFCQLRVGAARSVRRLALIR